MLRFRVHPMFLGQITKIYAIFVSRNRPLFEVFLTFVEILIIWMKTMLYTERRLTLFLRQRSTGSIRIRLICIDYAINSASFVQDNWSFATTITGSYRCFSLHFLSPVVTALACHLHDLKSLSLTLWQFACLRERNTTPNCVTRHKRVSSSN